MRTPSVVTVVSSVSLVALCVGLGASPRSASATARASAQRRVGRALAAADTDANAPAGSFESVATSARAPALVVWNQRDIRLSTDDGRTFSTVLVGPGAVRSVTLTDTGDVLAVREPNDPTQPGVLLSSISTTTQPQMSPQSVYAAGRYVVVAGRALGAAEDDDEQIARSTDGGRTWTTHHIPSWGNFHNAFQLDPDGVLRHVMGTEAGCGGGYQSLSRLDPSRAEWQDETWVFDAPTTAYLGPRGWVYAIDDRCDGDTNRERPCAAHGEHVVALGDPVDYETSATWGVATNGRTTLATLGGRLMRLEGASARDIARDVPVGFAIASVDDRGRALGTLRGRVVRWSAREGWRVIAE